MIKENLANLRRRIVEVAKRAARDPVEIELVVVTKNVPVDRILEAYEAGERKFGENRVQELLAKQDRLPKDIEWHLVGHLQTNKVRSVLGRVCLIHSVDSAKLAQHLEHQAQRAGLSVNVLLQVNISMEETKFGIRLQDFENLLKQVSSLQHIQVKGLMTMAPLTDREEKIRAAFRGLATLKDSWARKGYANLTSLSMGMTHDYEMAIEEGANLLRIGTAIFGARQDIHAAA